MTSIGFIILRHVNNYQTNKYWIYCYDCIRKFYPENDIVIIDDNSNQEFITEKELYNTKIIYSEYHKRGELLPYYYYAANKFFDIAVIIHDSVFIQKYIDFDVYKYKMIWNFDTHKWDQIEDETKMIKLFNDDELLQFYENKSLWTGCFGGMVVIKHDFLTHIDTKYNIRKLLDVVLTRYNRCSFERVIGCLLQKEHYVEVLFGDIHNYMPWGIKFQKKNIIRFSNLPILKIWTGR
jgi:hypothetical protein